MWRVATTVASFLMLAFSVAVIFLPSKRLVRHTKMLTFTGCLCQLASTAIAMISGLLNTASIVLWGGFFILGAFLTLEFLVWKIDTDSSQDVFVVRTLFRTRRIRKDAVVGITPRKHGGVLYLENGSRILADSVVGFEELVDELESYLAEMHHQEYYFLKGIPDRLFRGHLQNPDDLILAFVILFLFLAVACLFPLFESSRSEAPEDCGMLRLSPSKISVNERGTVTVEDPSWAGGYVCRNLKQIMESEDIAALIQKMTDAGELLVAVPEDELADDWDEQAYRRICAIQADGTELLSCEQSHKASQGEYNSILYVLLGIMLIYLVYVALFCYFVSNAEKYPRIVRWLFVKEDWLA